MKSATEIKFDLISDNTFTSQPTQRLIQTHVQPTNEQKVELCNVPPHMHGLILRLVSSGMLILPQKWCKVYQFTSDVSKNYKSTGESKW